MTTAGAEHEAKTIQPSPTLSTPSTVHSLPCKIHYDGRAAVSLYFQPVELPCRGNSSAQDDISSDSDVISSNDDCPKNSDDDKTKNKRKIGDSADPVSFVAQFRGRELRGKKYELPDGVQGVVLRGTTVERRFGDMHIWDHDVEPLATKNSVEKALDWCQIARAVHAPVALSGGGK